MDMSVRVYVDYNVPNVSIHMSSNSQDCLCTVLCNNSEDEGMCYVC